MGNMLAKFDVERAAWTSVQAPTDFNHAEFLLTPDEFPSLDGEQARWLGTVELVIRVVKEIRYIFIHRRWKSQ